MAKNTYFQFKQFRVEQKNCGMKVTSDASLFGASIDYGVGKTVLDIGTGTGILALMAAQKSSARIDAVELEEASAHQATENIKNSPWADRIQVHHCTIQEYAKSCLIRYDHIICNPPFYSDGTKSKEQSKRSAWHDEHLPFIELFEVVTALLGEKGKFHLLLPTDGSQNFLELCQKEKGLFPFYQIEVKPFSHSKANRVYSGYQREITDCVTQEWVMYDEPQKLSSRAHQLLKSFYLTL